MSDKLHQVLGYLCENYPHPHELSKARLTKMVYLADWRAALRFGRQITDIKWVFNHYGPYVDDVIDYARSSDDFEVTRTENYFGSPKEVVRHSGKKRFDALTSEDKAVLDFVIDATESKYWNDFIKLVYSTYPVTSRAQYSILDLPELAREYQVEDLVEWFFEHYEDPAHGVPYEGEYVYINGGPFDAEEVLRAEFPDVPEVALRAALDQILPEGSEWVRRGAY